MKHSIRKRVVASAVASLLCVPILLGTLAGCGGGSDGLTAEEDSGAISYADMGAVADTDAYAANALEKEITYLLSLDAKRLLYNFRDNAGLSVQGAQKYSGSGSWENSLIAGHTMGHYLSALSQAYANGGTPDAKKKQLKTRLDYIVSELGLCQAESGVDGNPRKAEAGFLWGGNKTNSSNVEFQFDNVEIGKTNINTEAWVPWYTMHKILAGLIDAYRLAGSEEALTVAKALGDWTYDRVTDWTEAKRRVVLSTEYGGMNDCLYNLYAVTGDEKYAVAAHQFDEDIPTQGSFSQTSMVELMYNNETNNYLQGQHANTTIPKIIGLLNGYIQTKDKSIEGVTEQIGGRASKPSMYLEVAENFWTRVVEHLSYVTGGNSEDEHFRADDTQNRYRDYDNCETCNTYNMLKLTRMLFSLTKDKKYLDYYENTYINAILSSQNPETGMTMYFQPMASGYYKTYSTPESSFWCCTGSGMESMSKLGDSIYYTAGNATYVAMYMSSTYKTEDVSLTMTADLENSDKVTVKVEDGETILRLRRPDWTTRFEVKLNGEALDVSESGDFVSVKVSDGAEVELTLGKQITMHNLPDAQNVYAFKYGPYVLSAELGTENMKSGTHGWAGSIEVPNKLAGLKEDYNISNDSMSDFKANINTYMARGEDGKFTLTGIEGGPLTYSIHYKQHTQRYSLYFRFIGKDSAPDTDNGFTERTVDSIQPGRGQYETSERMINATNSTGADSETSRYANAGGSFSYYMGVDKSKPDVNYLMTNFMKADNGKTIKMSVGSKVIFSATLNYTGTDTMYEVYIPIPKDVVNGATKRTIDTREMDCILIKIESKVAGQASARVVSAFNTLTRELKQGSIAYFVDCGDHDPTTLSSGDTLGLFQSVTDQVFGADAVTGASWGVVDEYNKTWGTGLAYSTPHGNADAIRGQVPNGGVSTNSTWAKEDVDDGADKTISNRYTKNQYECGLTAMKLSYKFVLPNGNYTVKMYFADPWECSKNADVAANGTNKLTNAACGQEVSFTVNITDGMLTLDVTNPVNEVAGDKCINLAYIIIAYAG